jgi:hypothetical protein
MEDGRIEFLRLQVESHLVESLLKCLEGIEVESLTVRNVHETRFGSDRKADVHFDVVGLAQLEIFVRSECRAAILQRIHAMRKPLDAEVTCQCGRMCSGGTPSVEDRGLIRLNPEGLTGAGEPSIRKARSEGSS